MNQQLCLKRRGCSISVASRLISPDFFPAREAKYRSFVVRRGLRYPQTNFPPSKIERGLPAALINTAFLQTEAVQGDVSHTPTEGSGAGQRCDDRDVRRCCP